MKKLRSTMVISLGSLAILLASSPVMGQTVIDPIEMAIETNEALEVQSIEGTDVNVDETQETIIIISETVPEVGPGVSEVMEITEEPPIEETQSETVEPVENRSKPRYHLVKDGYVLPNQHIDIQWLVHDMCERFNLPERYVLGLIMMESTFDTNDRSSANCRGLTQISPYWLKNTTVPTLEGNKRSRDLYNPYDNLLTMAEMMIWYRDHYGANLYNENEFKSFAYWWNTGRYKKSVNWKYSNDCIKFANEIVKLQ